MLRGDDYVFLQVLVRLGGEAGVASRKLSREMLALIDQGYCVMSQLQDGAMQIAITETGTEELQRH